MKIYRRAIIPANNLPLISPSRCRSRLCAQSVLPTTGRDLYIVCGAYAGEIIDVQVCLLCCRRAHASPAAHILRGIAGVPEGLSAFEPFAIPGYMATPLYTLSARTAEEVRHSSWRQRR